MSHGKDQGIGLGLTVVKKIAEGHGGRVELCETGPSGTVFAIEVPTTPGTAELAADVVPSATCPNNRPN